MAKKKAAKKKATSKKTKKVKGSSVSASKKVPPKKDLKKKGKHEKPGTKWFFVPKLYAPPKTLLKRILVMFKESEEGILGENEIIRAMEAAGVKDDGKKTVKRQVKGVLRNMSRSGVLVKQRLVKDIPELNEEDDDEEEEEESDEEESDEEESDEESDESDEENDDADEDEDEEDDEEEPRARKKSQGKKSKR